MPPPSISFPPNGTLVPLPAATAKDRTIVLKADGGRAPLTWLVNGQLLGNFDRFQPVLYTPDGEGMARVTVVDAQGPQRHRASPLQEDALSAREVRATAP